MNRGQSARGARVLLLMLHALNSTSCSRLKLTCHGNGYGNDASTATANTKTVSSFHITTPDSYERRRQSDSSTVSEQSSASTCSRYQTSPQALQQRNPSFSTVRLPSVSSILGADKYAPWNNPYVTDASITDRQNFEYAFFRQFSVFIGDKAKDISAMQTELMSYAMCDPVVWYAFIYAGASHRAYVSYLTSFAQLTLIKLEMCLPSYFCQWANFSSGQIEQLTVRH